VKEEQDCHVRFFTEIEMQRFAAAAVFVTAVVLLGGCSAGGSQTASGSAVSPGSALHSLTPTASVDPFAGLPYRLTLPVGWVGGGAATFGTVDELAKSNPALVEKIRSISPPTQNDFVAFDEDPNSIAGLSVNTLPRPDGYSDAEILDAAESQNVSGIKDLPGIVIQPVADRVSLLIGQAVHIRWTIQIKDASGAAVDQASTGYEFATATTVYTIVFVFAPDDSKAATIIESVMASFQAQ
jgi:hypothetical protein